MKREKFASELRPDNLLLIPEYDYFKVEKMDGFYRVWTANKVLRANDEIISDLTHPDKTHLAYHPMVLKKDSLRFLGFVEDQNNVHWYKIPGTNIKVSWDEINGLNWWVDEIRHAKITDIKLAHQLQNYIFDKTGHTMFGNLLEDRDLTIEYDK